MSLQTIDIFEILWHFNALTGIIFRLHVGPKVGIVLRDKVLCLLMKQKFGSKRAMAGTAV